jgi:hypothetical protein
MMRAKFAWSVLTILLGVSIATAGLVLPRQRDVDQRIDGHRLRGYIEAFKANERALVIVSGIGNTCLGLYVFDAQGNCIARDDLSDPQTADDLITEWIPIEQARYSIEVRNGGIASNEYQMGMR